MLRQGQRAGATAEGRLRRERAAARPATL